MEVQVITGIRMLCFQAIIPLLLFKATWATPDSMIDLFLERFHSGEETSRFLNHLVIVALDQKAYNRCISIHSHCFIFKTEGIDFLGGKLFMTDDYLKMMWRRIDFLRTVLEMGYSFVFMDADIMWFRNPFNHFAPDADFQIACDRYNGNPRDLKNIENGGFNYVRSNNRTIEFYKYWYSSHELYPGKHDQDVLNAIKYNKEMRRMRLSTIFLDTIYFGGFYERRKDFTKVCTIHANCCKGSKSNHMKGQSLLSSFFFVISKVLFFNLSDSRIRNISHSHNGPMLGIFI